MRVSLPALSRAVKRYRGQQLSEVSRLAAAARRDAGRSWSRKTAAVLEICVRNEPTADSTWTAVRSFSQLPPSKLDVQLLLPMLRKHAGGAKGAVLAVGDLAHAHSLLETLDLEFVEQYLTLVASDNSYRAIDIWKDLPAALKSPITGASLYIAANQLSAAERVAQAAGPVIPAFLTRRFIQAYAKQRSVGDMQRWIDQWQSPTPDDINWLHHITAVDPHLQSLHLPPPLERSTYFPVRRAVGKKLQNLVSVLNTALAKSPELFEIAAIKDSWQATIDRPSASTLEALAVELARAGSVCDWTAVIKLVSFSGGLKICELVPQQLGAGAYAASLAKAKDDDDAQKVFELIRDTNDVMYSLEFLNALSRRSPGLLLQSALPPDLLGFKLTPHLQSALWKAGPPAEIVAWLFPLTLESIDSASLLRSACIFLLSSKMYDEARRLLKEFVVGRRLVLDARVIEDLHRSKNGEHLKLQRLARPKPSGLDELGAAGEYSRIVKLLEIPSKAVI